MLGLKLGLDMDKLPAGGIPSASDALFWLDGTLSGSEFVDKTGNDRNFTITNKDFTASYFPYKSAATISAPAADATLIAADVNDFLYTAGTPNEIPIVSFFQNIDYADKLFCINQEQLLDAITGEENVEPYVKDIVLYSAALTGADLITAVDYYSVPTKPTVNVQWVSKDGNDGTATGTEALPYLTIAAAITGATEDDTICVKTGMYEEGATLSILKGIKIKGFGKVNLVSTGATSVFRFINVSDTLEFTRLDVDTRGTANVCYIDNAGVNGNIVSFTNCKFRNYKTVGISITAAASTTTVTDCVFVSSGQAASAGRATVKTATKATNPITSMKGCYIKDNSYEGINANVLSFQYNKQIYNNTAAFSTGFYSTAEDVDYSYNQFLSTNSNIGSATMSAVTLLGAKTVEIGYNIMSIVNENSHLAFDVFGHAANLTTSCHIHNNWIKGLAHGTHVLSVGTEATGVGDNQIEGIIIENNTVLCHRYYDPSQVIITHSIYVGFMKDAIIRYNYVNGGGINIIYKGSTGTDSTTAAIYGNVSINPYANCIMVKGIEGVGVYNNTCWTDNAVQDAGTNYLIYLLTNVGGDPPDNAIIKNNILMDVSASVDSCLIGFNAAITGLNPITIDKNVMYSANAFYGWRTDMRDATFLQWQSIGYDLNSIELTPSEATNLLEDTASEDFSLASGSAAIGEGETLAATYDDGLDASTNWGNSSTVPLVVTKQQTAPWDVGAYIS